MRASSFAFAQGEITFDPAAKSFRYADGGVVHTIPTDIGTEPTEGSEPDIPIWITLAGDAFAAAAATVRGKDNPKASDLDVMEHFRDICQAALEGTDFARNYAVMLAD